MVLQGSDIYSTVTISDSLALCFGLISTVVGVFAIIVTRKNHIARGTLPSIAVSIADSS
jgi:hypothetical protein